MVKASYVWLPLLPRLDGKGYELVYAEKWSPSDFHERARIPVLYNNGTRLEGDPVVPTAPSAQGVGSTAEPAGAAAEVCGLSFPCLKFFHALQESSLISSA